MKRNNIITVTVLGGGGEVGANCFQISVDGQQILLDSGTHPKKDGRDALPAFSLLKRSPDAVLISHGHVDHCGSVPYLAKQFPAVRTHATLPTTRIMDRMLHNSVVVMGTLARERGIRDYPLYDHEDVNFAMQGVRSHLFDAPFSLGTHTPVEVSFHQAGHVLGSASILMRTPGHTLFYTSDICESDQELMGGYTPLNGGVEVDTLMIEATHGATDESKVIPYAEEALRLGEAMNGVLRGGGTVLIPTFALGRTQEILNIIARLQEEGRIPSVPVYASGLGRAIYEIYDQFADYLAEDACLRPLDLFGRIGNVWEPSVVERLIGSPCIIVATSGMMLENTPSALIAQRMVQYNHHGIFFVGYLDHETPGYRLLHAGPGDEIQFQLGEAPVAIKLENIRRFHFSAHAPRSALKNLVRRLNPKNVVYVHGDPDALDWMRENSAGNYRGFIPTVGQTVTLEA